VGDAGAWSADHALSGPPADGRAEARALELMQQGLAVLDRPAALDDVIGNLIVFGGTQGVDHADLAERIVSRSLLTQIGIAYERGWQPADLMHVVRRETGGRIRRLAGAAVLEQALQFGAFGRAPQEWLRQLTSILGSPPAEVGRPAKDWNAFRVPAAGTSWENWHDVLVLLGSWLSAPAMPRLVPVPSAWGQAPRRPVMPVSPTPAVSPDGHDPKKLATIRALLAKAEATEFAEEADAFTAKAQDLMTRYSIDEALISGNDEAEIPSRRVHIDDPYAVAKAQLLAAVAQVNRVRAIWDDARGIATIVGLPVDLGLTEMLFTSLLVQATRAMTEAGAAGSSSRRPDRAPAFRRAFLLAYAQRIGERLAQAGAAAQQQESEHRGADLLPVLARHTAAVEQAFDRLFPHTTVSRARTVDARGWHAGTAAADRAVLAKAQVGPGA